MPNWPYIYQVLPLYEKALWLTVKISAAGILLAFIIGVLCSTVVFYRIKILAPLASGYVAFFRNTPLLLHLFFIYYGLPRAFGLVLSFETTALLGLSLLGGSYMAETLRGGIKAVSKQQIEAGQAIGLNRLQLIRYIVFPQAFSYSVPTLGANCIFLFKETSVFTAIAGTDITTIAISLINTDARNNENLFMLVIAYMVVLIPFIILLSYTEKRMRHAEFGV